MVFLNETNIIYATLSGLTTNITGSWVLTLLFITAIIIMFAFAFRIPLEFTALLIFPLLIGFAAMTADYMAVLGVAIIYITVLLGKNLFFWR